MKLHLNSELTGADKMKRNWLDITVGKTKKAFMRLLRSQKSDKRGREAQLCEGKFKIRGLGRVKTDLMSFFFNLRKINLREGCIFLATPH